MLSDEFRKKADEALRKLEESGHSREEIEKAIEDGIRNNSFGGKNND